MRPLVAEVSKLKSDLSYLTTNNKRLLSTKESAVTDYNFMKTQYDFASTAARDRANEALAAENETIALKKALSTGMKQIEEFGKAKELAWKEEVDRLQFELSSLKEQARRSDGAEIRTKAALWESHLEDLKAATEPENLALKADDVVDQVKAKQIEEERLRLEAEVEAKKQGTFLFDSSQRSQIIEEASQEQSEERTISSISSSNDPMVFQCEWKDTSQICGEIVSTRDVSFFFDLFFFSGRSSFTNLE